MPEFYPTTTTKLLDEIRQLCRVDQRTRSPASTLLPDLQVLVTELDERLSKGDALPSDWDINPKSRRGLGPH